MNPPNVGVWQPTPAIYADLIANAAGLIRHIRHVVEDAVIHGRLASKNKNRVDEVETLSWFFVYGLPMLQSLWNAQLSGTKIEIKGIFCHRTLTDGPTVTSAAMTGARELSDLLFIVSCDGSSPGRPFGSAFFLQAKSERKLSGKSSPEQKKLYEDAVDFEFVDKPAVASAFFDNPIGKPGQRSMPTARERGFKFWFFENEEFGGRPAPLWWRGAAFPPSTTAAPPFIGNSDFDGYFCETLFYLMLGLDGLAVSTPTPGNYGWSRIVRDVVAMSVNTTLGGKNTVVAPHSRTTGALPPGVLSQLIAANHLVVVSNPFSDLAKAFGDEKLGNQMDELAKKKRDEWPKEPPPPKHPIPNRRAAGGEGGGSFIWIRMSERDQSSQTIT